MSKRQGCLWLGVTLFLLLLAAGIILFRWASQQVNPAGFLGKGVLAEVSIPAGFRVQPFAEGLNGPRFMALGPDGVLHVADRGNDRIVALPDADGDGIADEIRVVAEGLNSPHSLVYQQGAWYVGVPGGVVRLEDTDGDGVADTRTAVVDDLPAGGQHSTRTVAFLPDGRMVVSVGSSCNVCEEDDPRRAAIVVYDGASGGGETIFAGGLRNAVGLAVHPQTGDLWASNNGRDLMGDDMPPETVYRVEQSTDYGWPTCHAGDILDPDMGAPGACDGVPEPALEMQAHMAPLGLTFYTGDAFPAGYRGNMFIAFHGSWNRSVPVGYKVMRVPFSGGVPAGAPVDFATGWLQQDGSVSGRPVDVTVGGDGALYVSDDKGGIIYRISYTGS